MKVLLSVVLVCAAFAPGSLGQDVRQMERSGDAAGVRAALASVVQNSPNDVQALANYAEFLDRHSDPGARAAYGKLLAALKNAGNAARTQAVARRLAELDLLAGDRASAARSLDAFRAANGKGLDLPAAPASSAVDGPGMIEIPGPLRSFARMAAVSSDLGPDDLLAALARNVVTNGYQASHSNDALEQTEYLKLVHRYLSQARELDKLAGEKKVIEISNCESKEAGDLLRIIGYRMRGGCGSEVVLETVNASRAFLTTDSGFPLANLEQALRTNRPFTYDYHPTRAPVMYGADYWLTGKEKGAEFIDNFLSDPSLCRLYLGLSKLDRDTAAELRKAMPAPRIKAFAHVLDFFGGMFEIRDGKAIVPGGEKTAAAWAELAGAPPSQGAAFFEKLLARDDGWLASLFDAMSRMSGPAKDYLTDPARLKRFYTAIRGRVTSPGPARPVFRSNADMMLLTTRLRVDANGRAHIPGGLEVWKNLFVNHPHGKYDGKLTKSAVGWKEPEDVLEALFGLSRKAVENEPLKIFMAVSDLDRNRAKPLEPDTVDKLARNFKIMGSQYAIFNDAPAVSDKTVVQFLDTALAISKIKDQLLRADTAGTMQALVGLWQIFSRQGLLPAASADASLSSILGSFAQIRADRDLFDGGRNGVTILLKATGTKDGVSPHDRLVDLLSGTGNPTDIETHGTMVKDAIRVLEAQHIVSLKTLFDLADHLESLGKGEKLNTALVNRFASRISEIQLPRAALTTVEKNAYAFGYWTERHVENQRKVNLRATIDRAAGNAEKLKDARGLMAPFLRDTLVAFNYAHYAPPGAQILYTNPLFVRGHDFLGVQGSNHTWRATEMFGTGWPSNGGGRLVGSLSGLAYALAEAEQNFLIPSQTQALIWADLVPQMILSAKIPRWWNTTPAQMHWIGLHMRYGQTLLAEAALDSTQRAALLDALSAYAAPARTRAIAGLLAAGDAKGAAENIMPAELYAVAADTVARRKDTAGPLLSEIARLRAEVPNQVSNETISRAFGTPKPTLANSYRPELLKLRTFPTLMGYSSRIMAESWESNTLYWVSLADEVHASPGQLNVLIPEWTRRVVERIFASHLEDWPALLRSLNIVGEDVRAKSRSGAAAEQKASLQ
ncbi:MAG: hypothetical protein EXQ52_04545 [Bryobacterales bacterium]|nr:hypothetical protein [Bryobacterales bacterium]